MSLGDRGDTGLWHTLLPSPAYLGETRAEFVRDAGLDVLIGDNTLFGDLGLGLALSGVLTGVMDRDAEPSPAMAARNLHPTAKPSKH